MPSTRNSLGQPSRPTRSQGPTPTQVATPRGRGQKVTVKGTPKTTNVKPDRKQAVPDKADVSLTRSRAKQNADAVTAPKNPELQTEPSSDKNEAKKTDKGASSEGSSQGRVSQKRSAESPGKTESSKKPKTTGAKAVEAAPGDTTPTDTFSPRRSSRAVVPNSRFKDMELLGTGKKKSAGKEKEKTKPEPKREQKGVKVDFTKINVQLQPETPTVMEEVVTEETHIDTLAQMNMFDEILILPQTSAAARPVVSKSNLSPELTVLSPSDTSGVSSAVASKPSDGPNTTAYEDASSSMVVGKVTVAAGETSTVPVETNAFPSMTDYISMGSIVLSNESLASETVMSSTDSVVSSASGGKSSVSASPMKSVAPQVIVVPGKSSFLSEGKRKIPMLNDQNKGKVIIMGPDDIKRPKPRKIIVSPTHVMKGQGPQRLSLGGNAEQLRISKGVVETITKDSANSGQTMLSNTVPVKVKTNLITAGQIIHTPLKNGGDMKSHLFQSQNLKKSDNIAEAKMKSATMLVTSPELKTHETSANSGSFVESKVVGRSKPQINVVYVKAKAKPDTFQEQKKSHLRYEVITAPTSFVDNETDIEKSMEEKDPNVAINNQEILTTDNSLNTGENSTLEMVMENPVTDLNKVDTQVEELKAVDNQNEIRYFEEIVNVPGEPEEVLMTNDKLSEDIKTAVADAEPEKPMEVFGEGLELASEVQSLPVGTTESKKSVDQKLMSSLCQVIKYDKVKEPETRTQTAIEYVMFDDKMVPIHKPYTASHGRVQVTRVPAAIKRTHGRVESQGQLDKGQVKKIPVSTAQTAITSIIDQIGDDKTSEGLDLGSITIMGKTEEDILCMSDTAVTMADTTDIVQEEEVSINTVQPARVIHGYIDQPAKQSAEGTKVVEISQDLFAKEVYGDSLVLDAVTGEMVPITMVSMANSQVLTDVHTSVVPMLTEDDTDTGTKTSQDTDGKVVETSTEGLPTWNESSSSSDIHRQSSGLLNVKPDLDSPDLKSSNIVELPDVDMLGLTSNPNITVEKMASGEEAVVVHINQEDFVKADADTGVAVTKEDTAVTETANVIKLVDVKITPVSSYNGVAKPENKATVAGVDAKAIKTEVKAATATLGTNTTEIETQTEDTDDDDDDESDVEEIGVSDEEQETRIRQVVMVTQQASDDSPLKRTKMTVSEDGQCQEYVVVHLPEGTEIKQAQARQVIQDPIHDEVVTMSPDGMYICVDCNHKTDKKGNWFKHRRKHLGIRPHACTKCSYRAATSSNLKRHMQIHDDIRNFACATCGLLFRQKIHLERHVKYRHQEKNVKCPLCDYLCASENPDLKIHIRRRHMPQEDGSMSAFTCNECGLMTVSKKDLKQHMKFHKKGPELKLFCEYCSFVTDCESRLRRHVLIHTKERPFQCGLCAYRATQKEHVLRHMRSQHDIEVERKQRKPIVQMKEKPRRSLLEGLHFTSKDISDDSEESEKPFEKSDYSSTDKIFACNHCTMKFSKLINLYKHLYAQHRQVMPDPSSSDFQCVVCEFRTNNKKNLLVHMRKHNMQDHTPPSHVYSCVLCRYINPRRRNLFQHMKKKHGIEIMMKEDGLNCYVTSDNSSLVLGQQEGEASVMALSDIVTTQTVDEDSQLQIVTDDNGAFSAEKISIDNIISVEDIPSYVSMTQEQAMVSLQSSGVSTSQLYQPTVAEHEAAEAIEGLQALAQQAGILETQTIESDINTEIVSSEIMTDGEILATEEVAPLDQGEEGTGIQLSSEQLNQLSSGDYVEINGEVYKVEIAQEGAAK